MSGNNKDSNRIHIILDASKVNRCVWCGSPVSDHWISGEGGSFCTEECQKEWWKDKNSEMYCLSGGLAILFAPLLLAILFLDSPIDGITKFEFAVFGLVMVITLVIITISSYRDHSRVPDRPKDSRRNIGISEVSLLRNISIPVECPNCDAIIDMENIGDDMVYHCQYCGANGVIEIKIVE